MPISIVVGGQFGSEGKGKVACFLAESHRARAVVRVGGPNSGHTVIDAAGRTRIFRQLPTAAILSEPVCVLSAGSYIDLDILRAEIALSNLKPARLKIDAKAVVITSSHKERERNVTLKERVGSTLTGTGAAVSQRINREPETIFAAEILALRDYIADTSEYLYKILSAGDRVVAEGSQGYGLSAIHTPYFPYATSRDTTAAGVLSEIGLSPLSVDEIALVIRAFPIRVPGNSGPLPQETSWEEINRLSGSTCPFDELTSVTRSRRRIARFDEEIVLKAIRANEPTSLFLNHVDYIDKRDSEIVGMTPMAENFVTSIEHLISRPVDYVGLGPRALFDRRKSKSLVAA